MYKVYLITNTKTGLQYVGMTCQGIRQRWQKHCSPRTVSLLKQDIDKYGKEVFEIEELSSHENVLDAMIDELLHIKELNTQYPAGYNRLYSKAARKAIGKSNLGRKCSEETKEKIRQARYRQEFSPEVLERRAESIRGIFNTPITCSNGKQYKSLKEASKDTNIPDSSISRILIGYTDYKRSRHGLNFWYTEGYSNGSKLRRVK